MTLCKLQISVLAALCLVSTCLGANIPFDGRCAPPERLTTIYFNYVDFSGQQHAGSVKTLDTISEALKNIFDELGQNGYPIYSANVPSLLNNGDIDNTVSYDCRSITAGKKPSLHAYGAAVDLNPRENPYIHFTLIGNTNNYRPDYVIPESGWQYITRQKYREGKLTHFGIITQEVVDIFKKYGILRWGGDWNFPIDYMHFEIYRDNALLFLTMNTDESKKYFKSYTNFYNRCRDNFPTSYRRRKFQDLSRAIAAQYGQTPIDIYMNLGIGRLNAIAEDMLNNHIDKQSCLTPSSTEGLLRQQHNPALVQIQELRKIHDDGV